MDEEMTCVTQPNAIDYVVGALNEAEMRDIRRHAARCEVCRALLDGVDAISEGVNAAPGEFDDPGLTKDIMTLIDMGRGQAGQLPRMSRRTRWATWIPAVAAAALIPVAIMLIDLPRNPVSRDRTMSGVTSRGNASSDDSWVHLELFRRDEAAGDTRYLPIASRLDADAAVAIAYEDRSEHPFSYLMVFAVDADGDTHWYYPAFENPSDTPESIPLGAGGGRVILPDEITHDFPAGPVAFFGIFSRVPLDVRQVEAELERQIESAGDVSTIRRLDFEETGQWSKLLTVTPPEER